jgi:DNA polymerase-3 subunit epsilon
MLKLKTPLAFFDLETTGTDIVKDRIVEIAIVKLMPNGERISRCDLVNPEIAIPKETTQIHGISDADVADKPTFKQLAKNLAKFLEGCDLCGFNILKFDLPLLAEEFLRAGEDIKLDNRKVVDAMRIFHIMEPRTLGAAYRFYCGKELHDAHSAQADTEATLDVLLAQVERYKDVEIKDNKTGKSYAPIGDSVQALHDLTVSNLVDYAGRMVKDDSGNPVFNFGKHKGRPVLEVLQKEPSYYDWMMKGDFPLNTKQKLTEIKLSMFKK